MGPSGPKPWPTAGRWMSQGPSLPWEVPMPETIAAPVRRKRGKSPTARSLEFLRKSGDPAVVEKHSPFGGDVSVHLDSLPNKRNVRHPTRGWGQRWYSKNCIICGKHFYGYRPSNMCCSRKCGAAYRSGPFKALDRTPTLTCLQCDAKYWRKPRPWVHKFCTVSCYAEWLRVNSTGALNKNYKNAG